MFQKKLFFFDLNSYYPFEVAETTMEKSYFLDGPHKKIRNHLHISHKVSLEQEIWSCSLFETWDSTHIYQSVYYQRSIIYQPQKIPQRFKLCHIVPLSLVLYLMSPFKKLQLVAWLHFPTFTFDWELEFVFFCHS